MKFEKYDIKIGGSNRIEVEMKSPVSANQILQLEILKKKEHFAYIPDYLIR